MAAPCRFDDSLPRLVQRITTELGPERARAGVVLRDVSGALAFFADTEFESAEQCRISALLREDLGAYARPDRVLIGRDEAGACSILSDPGARLVQIESSSIRYIDRRVVGADWLRAPTAVQARPPRIAFASLKGGVGRSTAVSVVAAEQARRGRNVLVVDLDLEAPGVGSLLLTADRRPLFGALDYLVERNLGALALQRNMM
ncbi:MAG: AAA family ATPase [Candidatus Riflebacteria bacterium]|nr:AAA family ATPase [Candidatus Riflebacteria bacterium]